MTPQQEQPSAPWWQTLLATLLGAVVTGVTNHYLGPYGGIVAGAATTGIAHALPSPKQQVKK